MAKHIILDDEWTFYRDGDGYEVTVTVSNSQIEETRRGATLFDAIESVILAVAERHETYTETRLAAAIVDYAMRRKLIEDTPTAAGRRARGRQGEESVMENNKRIDNEKWTVTVEWGNGPKEYVWFSDLSRSAAAALESLGMALWNTRKDGAPTLRIICKKNADGANSTPTRTAEWPPGARRYIAR